MSYSFHQANHVSYTVAETIGEFYQFFIHKPMIGTLDNTAQKMKLSITDFFSKCDKFRRKLRIWSHLLKNP